MGRKRKTTNRIASNRISPVDWLPPESSPSKFYSRLIFTDARQRGGPLEIVGRELQLVWYRTERDRSRDRNGKLVAVFEFCDCRRSLDYRGERYQFGGVLLEDMSGEYREWVGHQQHRGRRLADDTDVVETDVRFSVAVRDATEGLCFVDGPSTEPFCVEHPDVEQLSSPQLDMLFEVMGFLYENIPAMRLMQDLRAQHVAELAE